MIDLNEMSQMAYEIAEKRYQHGAFGKHKNNVPNLLKHCAGEVVEAAQAYSEWVDNTLEFDELKEEFMSELADVIMCILIAAAIENIDIEKALTVCLEKNMARANGVGDKK